MRKHWKSIVALAMTAAITGLAGCGSAEGTASQGEQTTGSSSGDNTIEGTVKYVEDYGNRYGIYIGELGK